MDRIKYEFNQKDFKLDLRNYFDLAKYKTIRLIFGSCVMILLFLAITIGTFVFIDLDLNKNENFQNDKIAIIGYLGIAGVLVAFSFLIFGSFFHYQIKKILKNLLQKEVKKPIKITIYYLTFIWTSKLYFSQSTIQNSLKELKKEFDGYLAWEDENKIDLSQGPIKDELGQIFPEFALASYVLIIIIFAIPLLEMQIGYKTGRIYRIKKNQIVQDNFATIAKSYGTILINNSAKKFSNLK